VKYVVIIPLGAADLPLEELGDRTPLEAAHAPNLDAAAAMGRVGCVFNTPQGWTAGSDVCVMSSLGANPTRHYTGRAPFEALAMGVELAPADTVMRLSLITCGQPGTDHDGRVLNPTAGEITGGEAAILYADLVTLWAQKLGDRLSRVRVTAGAGFRGLLVDSSGRDYSRLRLLAPADILGEVWRQHLPSGDESAALLREMIELSAAFLPRHEVNLARTEQGLAPANLLWPWGLGVTPALPSLRTLHGLRSAMLAGTDLYAGLGAAMGMVPALDENARTSQPLRDEEIGREAVRAINAFDLVCIVVDTPDAASRLGDAAAKVAAIESIDRHIVGPVLAALMNRGDPEERGDATGWRLLVTPAHATLTSTKTQDAMPVPFVLAGAWVRGEVKRAFHEADAEESDLQIDPGHELMEYFINAGVPLTHRVGAKVRSKLRG
jgi:2,3-bisphosphoglycerate-independent phosphoglycerate mutase